MIGLLITTIAGLVIGSILAAAHWYSPALEPWVVGFMIACLSLNLVIQGNSKK